MSYIHKLIQSILHYKENGVLTLLFNILVEFLFIGYIGFLSLFTLEMILPLFVTSHISLTKLFIILSSLSFFTLILGRIIEENFEIYLNKKNPFLWMGLLLALGIFSLSLFQFPLGTIPFILIAFFTVLWFLWDIFFLEHKEKV